MSNAKNIEGQGFHTDPDRRQSGRTSRNKATILKEVLALIGKSKKDSEIKEHFGHEGDITIERALTMSAVIRAYDDQATFKELMDIVHGKNPDIVTGDREAPVYTQSTILKEDLTGQDLIDELKRRGLPTEPLEK